jgi:hypothetical protein
VLGGQNDVWAYRSDSPAPAPVVPDEGTSAALRAEPPVTPRIDTPARRSSARSSAGWIGTGIGLMAMPLTLTMMAMIAPALWIFGSRGRH